MSGVAPLTPAALAVALREADRVAAEQARHRRLTQWLRVAGLVLALAFVGWKIYGAYFVEPTPLPLASGTRSTVLTADSWPAENGDTGGRRMSEAPAALTGTEAWRRNLGAALQTGIVGDAERLYVPLTDGNLVAIATRDGSEVWRRHYPEFLLAPPALAGGRLYVPIREGKLQALDAATGAALWDAPVGTLLTTSPLVDRGTVYVFSARTMFGIDAETGRQLWRRDVDTSWSLVEREFERPVLNEDYVAVAISSRLLVFDRRTGVGTYWFEFQSTPDEVATDGGNFYGLSSPYIASIPQSARRPWWDGVRRAWFQFYVWGMVPAVPPPPANWVRGAPPRGYFSPAVGADALYVSSANGSAVAYSRRDGLPTWKQTVGTGTGSPTLVANGLLVPVTGALLLLDPRSGAELARRPLGFDAIATIVASHGTYAAAGDGTVIALR